MSIQVGGTEIKIGILGITFLIFVIGGIIISGAKIEIGSLCFPVDKCNTETHSVTPDFEVTLAAAVASTLTANAPTPNVLEIAVAETLTAIAAESTPSITIIDNQSATIGPGPSPSYTSTLSATATNVPTNTPVPPTQTPPHVLIDTIEVLGSSNTGAEFAAPQTGRYFLRFNRGGYCTHGTNPGFPTCLPTVWLFASGVDLWEDDGRTLNQNNAFRIIAPVSDCGAGRGAYCNTIAEAEAQGRNSSEVRINLEAGSTWILIGVDHRDAYLDNPGTVFIDVFFQP